MKRILTSKEYRFIKGLDESFDFETESTIYLGECFSDDELNELLEKNLAHIIRIKEEYKTNL